jgi:hypothetical protein
MFGTEKAEMADRGHADIGRRDGQDVRRGRGKS